MPIAAVESRTLTAKHTNGIESLRHVMSLVMTWFTFFVTVNYATMGWFADTATPNKDLIMVAAGLFICQNALGIIGFFFIDAYFRSSRKRLQGSERPELTETDNDDAIRLVAVYRPCLILMGIALLLILGAWIIFALVLRSSPGVQQMETPAASSAVRVDETHQTLDPAMNPVH